MSKRTVIRENLQQYLVEKTSAGQLVFLGRGQSLPQDQVYPVILIYGGDEGATPRDTSRYGYIRTYEVSVEVRTRDVDAVDAIADEVGEEIETAMETAGDLNESCISFDYTGSEMNIDNEGEYPFGSLIMKFQFKYTR